MAVMIRSLLYLGLVTAWLVGTFGLMDLLLRWFTGQLQVRLPGRRRKDDGPFEATRRPIQDVAADLRRLSRQLESHIAEYLGACHRHIPDHQPAVRVGPGNSNVQHQFRLARVLHLAGRKLSKVGAPLCHCPRRSQPVFLPGGSAIMARARGPGM